MFETLNALFLGFHIVASPIYVRNDTEIQLPALGGVVYKEGFKPELFRESCRYAGVVVAFDRDWEDEVTIGEQKIVRPAEPGKLAGYAFLVNKELCPGKPAQRVSYVYDTSAAGATLGAKALVKEGHQVQTLPLTKETSELYRWLPQVMRRIEAVADTNPAAKSFLEFLRQSTETKTSEASR